MIHTNLSTRPFYNERLVNTVLLVLALAVAAVTVVNVLTIMTWSRKDAALGTATVKAEREATEARRKADQVRRGIDVAALATVGGAAQEANQLIDRRTFSWTELLGELEAALPPDVRIVSILPQLQRNGPLVVTMTLVAQRAEDVNTLAEKLESRGAFEDLLQRQETVNPEGLLETTLSGRYVGKARRAGPTK